MLLLHALTIFLGAALVFLVQPLIGRLVLPAYGGAPAVWNTCLLFFQSVLLAGYLVVHLLARRSVLVQVIAMGGLLVLGALALPFALDDGRGARGEASPVFDLLAALAVTAGLPFLVVSMVSPLLQRWFSTGYHHRASDPYFLYAASNAGSLLGLIAYPLLFERVLPVAGQARAWSILYGALVVLIGACAVVAFRASRGTLPAGRKGVSMRADRASPVSAPPSWRRRIRWILLACVPSSLLMGVTSFITTDLVVVPLLWVLPLSLYLISFILAFATVRSSGGDGKRSPLVPVGPLRRAVPIAIVAATILYVSGATEPMWLLVGGHLLVLAVVATAAHGELAADRPSTDHLTGFYLLISAGGALGGVFNALIAPIAFSGTAEYPLTLIAAAALIPSVGVMFHRTRRSLLVAGSAVVGLFVLTTALCRMAETLTVEPGPPRLALSFGLPVLLAFIASRQSVRFALSLGALLLAGLPYLGPGGELLERSRTFHGVHRVVRMTHHAQDSAAIVAGRDLRGAVHHLYHGTTLHGTQGADAASGMPIEPLRPLAYYTRSGPIGDVFTVLAGSRVGLVGLGAGSLAAYAGRDDHFTFFEIDPDVARIADDERYFSFMSAARARGAVIDVVLGDARLTLRDVPDESFDVLVLDAFSSDSVPAHLLTREALALYVRSLRRGGLLAMHISNRYLDLEPVIANLVEDAGIAGVIREDFFSADAPDADAGRLTSTWVVLARRDEDLDALSDRFRNWRALRTSPRVGVWTDDWSDLMRVLRR